MVKLPAAPARAMAEYLITKLYSSLAGLRPEAQGESLQEIMEAGVNEANQAVIQRLGRHDFDDGPGDR